MAETNGAARQKMAFQAEVQQLLHLVVHSLYSNKEIFLRELVSNASDACDKLRFEAAQHPELFEGDGELKICIDYDRDARTVTIRDNGIGMSREEAVAHLGTIAKSGTREFLQRLGAEGQADARLIGQFGVGFYSAFIVADRVTVRSRRAGLPPSAGVLWECAMTGDAAGAFEVAEIERPERGTEVVLHLREGEDEFLSGVRLRELIRQYSDHILWPILMRKERWDESRGELVKEEEWEQVNRASALWARPKQEISEEEYVEFYKHVAHDFEAPLAWVHAKVEGRHEYTMLLYLPQRAPFDLFERTPRHGLKLYVRRVFVLEDAERLLPRYLRFVRGVVDAADLPLNVSREMLQDSREIEAIRAGVTKRVLGLLEQLAKNEPEKYARFWREFGRVLKEGIIEDPANRERIAALLRFASTHSDSPEETVALDDYLARMKPGQERIYYLTAESFAAARHSPHLEAFRSKGVEVLLLTDRIDEWWVAYLPEYQGKPLASVAKGEMDAALLSEDEKKAREKADEQLKPLLERLQATLGERVKAVRVSSRLTEAPACLVVEEHEPGMQLARLLRELGQEVPAHKPILELNPAHPVIARLQTASDDAFADWALLLYEEALLAEGGKLEDPAAFVQRMNRLLLTA
ncbi:MAG: molecular chaperone HtpG [Rhodocyclales bacterium]|nr:molecular chaperone HtpG [Rhodocyclales bacterium]